MDAWEVSFSEKSRRRAAFRDHSVILIWVASSVGFVAAVTAVLVGLNALL